MSTTKAPKSPAAIRLSITPEVRTALRRAKRLYPALSDPEILKLGLSKVATEESSVRRASEKREIMDMAAYSVGYDYLSDPEEDIYTEVMGKSVDFS
jgi:hypothetical protein